MSRNLNAGRAKLTDTEKASIDADLHRDGNTPSAQDRAFKAQLRLARKAIAKTRTARREKGRVK